MTEVQQNNVQKFYKDKTIFITGGSVRSWFYKTIFKQIYMEIASKGFHGKGASWKASLRLLGFETNLYFDEAKEG